MADDAGMERLLEQIRAEIGGACERVLTCEPDYMVMGMSAETFWDGVEGNRAFKQQINDITGLDVATGAEACERALQLYGARRIGVVTPYQPIGDENVRQVLRRARLRGRRDQGPQVPDRGRRSRTSPRPSCATRSSRSTRPTSTRSSSAAPTCAWPSSPTRPSAGSDKPVIAINAATWWMALRDNGIDDQLHGYGSLLRDH